MHTYFVESVLEHSWQVNATPGCFLPFNFGSNVAFGNYNDTVSWLFLACCCRSESERDLFCDLENPNDKWTCCRQKGKKKFVFLLLNIPNIQLLKIGIALVKITGSLQWRWDAIGLNPHLWKLPSVCDSCISMSCANSGPESLPLVVEIFPL